MEQENNRFLTSPGIERTGTKTKDCKKKQNLTSFNSETENGKRSGLGTSRHVKRGKRKQETNRINATALI
jgi:hypothetical protein